jgi:CDP-diacylglycerol--serine O-phosphatidyltransferase
MRRHGKGFRRRRWNELRAQRGRGIFLLPAFLTIGNLFSGFFSLILTLDQRYPEAAYAIFVAMVMDMLDGRVARLVKATSQFGVEFDSLADVVSFCVAPAFLLYAFALADMPRAAWFGTALFLICGALRLARFNVSTGTVDKRFFVGLPTPAGAAVVASTVILLNGTDLSRWELVALACGSYVVALLMVSTFRYWSFKDADVVRRRPVQTLLVVILAVMIVATNPEWFLFLAFLGYVVSGPIGRLILGRTITPVPAELSTRDAH